MKHLRYLRYVIRHKWFVLCACWRNGLFWQGLVHDWSKFLPSEWGPYADFFYGEKPTEGERERAVRQLGHDPYISEHALNQRRWAFNRAWLKHQHRSPHHWQHWVLHEDSGALIAIRMPERYAVEMMCDWEGAGRAITGKRGGTLEWYVKNRRNMIFHMTTQAFVDHALGYNPMEHSIRFGGGDPAEAKAD